MVHDYVLVLAIDLDDWGSDAEDVGVLAGLSGHYRPRVRKSVPYLTSTPEEEAAMVTTARAGPVRTRPLPAEAFTDEATYRETRLPVDLAVTLIPDAYTSAEFFGLERERVFA